MVSTLIALILVVVLLHFFFRKPILNGLIARQNAIQSHIDETKRLKLQTQTLLDEHSKKILNAHKEANRIIKEAKEQAERLSENYVKKAFSQAEAIKSKARQEIEREQREFEEQAKKYIIETAVDLARNILEREVTFEDDKRLLKLLLQQNKGARR